jgi:hypothetical protein
MGALLSTAEEAKNVSGNGCVYKIYNKSKCLDEEIMDGGK